MSALLFNIINTYFFTKKVMTPIDKKNKEPLNTNKLYRV